MSGQDHDFGRHDHLDPRGGSRVAPARQLSGTASISSARARRRACPPNCEPR